MKMAAMYTTIRDRTQSKWAETVPIPTVCKYRSRREKCSFVTDYYWSSFVQYYEHQLEKTFTHSCTSFYENGLLKISDNFGTLS